MKFCDFVQLMHQNYEVKTNAGEFVAVLIDAILDDAALEKDYSVYAELAKKKAEECKLMNGPIDRVEYSCQGYSGNDPDITVNVIGENGEMISMSFSRYDQAFLGLTTDTARRISDTALENLSGGVETETITVEFDQ